MNFRTGFRHLIILAITLLVFARFVYADCDTITTSATCNSCEGIWCSTGTPDSNYCLRGDSVVNSNSQNKCIVDASETVTLSDFTIFNFLILNVTSTGNLHFLTTKYYSTLPTITDTPSITKSVGGNGGIVGDGVTGCSACGGRWGGFGANGGDTLSAGSSALNAVCGGDTYAGGTGGQNGAYLQINANTLEVNNFISVDGATGGSGSNAPSDDGGCGCQGAGGGGGGGGGIIIITVANPLLGKGNISSSGGKGGYGGAPTDESGNVCGDSGDHGGGGGSGGGGAAGYVIIRDYLEGAVHIIQSGGVGGLGTDNPVVNNNCACQMPGQASTGGTLGQQNFLPETNCNDGIDNDGNFLTDMDDPTCIDSALNAGYDVSANPVFKLDSIKYNYNPSAMKGSDGVCGDDSLQTTGACSALQTTNLCLGKNEQDCKSANCDLNYTESSIITTKGSSEGTICTSVASAPSCDTLGSGYKETSTTTGIIDCCFTDRPYLIGTECYASKYSKINGAPAKKSGTIVTSRTCVLDPVFKNCYDASYSTPSCNYNTASECTSAECIWTSFNSNLLDLGFVDPTQQYMCYNNQTNLNVGAQRYSWNWLNAGGYNIPLNIFPVNITPQTDFISNGYQWFYCNATPIDTSGNAIAIPEGGSFTTFGGQSNTVVCAQAMTYIFGYTFKDTCPSNGQEQAASCCYYDAVNNRPLTVPITDLSVCLNKCVGKDGSTFPQNGCDPDPASPYHFFCDNPNIPNPSLNENDVSIDKSLCLFDGSNCLNDPSYSSTTSCSANKGTLCAADQYCTNGFNITTVEGSDTVSKDNGCCFNPQGNALCQEKKILNTNDDCIALGGAPYDPSTYLCNGENASIGSTSSACCFYTTSLKYDYFGDLGWFKKVSPDSFTCYKQQGNNIISQCVYDNTSINIQKETTNGKISDSAQRIYAQGSQTHTLLSYDIFRKGIAVDQVMKMKLVDVGLRSQTTDARTMAENYVNSLNIIDTGLDGYSNLEFDILYPVAGINLNMTLVTKDSSDTILTYDLGRVSDYSTSGGGEARRWHHESINLAKIGVGSGERYAYLQFYDVKGANYYIVVDSITLKSTTAQDHNLNTPNYYCTGGFGTWIKDLDPPAGTDFTNWNSYGPYKFACEAQAAFGWTGTNCCGDDTRFNYGEHFNDTQSGCFNGSTVLNGWPVSYAKGIGESNKVFDDYTFKDLIYYNNTFVGCQYPQGKYDSLMVSHNGTNTESKNLVDAKNNMQGQCAVIGNYYCMNNAWRQKVVGDANGEVNIGTAGIRLKQGPPGEELVTNGNFGGHAPQAQGSSPPTVLQGKDPPIN